MQEAYNNQIVELKKILDNQSARAPASRLSVRRGTCAHSSKDRIGSIDLQAWFVCCSSWLSLPRSCPPLQTQQTTGAL